MMLWKEPWNELGVMYNQFLQVLEYHPSCHQNVTVVVVIEGKKWHIPDHARVLLPNIFKHMEWVTIGEGKDSWVWTTAHSGKYRMKETYERIIKRKMEVEWPKIVWFKKRIPRHSFITWIAILGGIKIQDKLYSWGLINSCICVFYDRGWRFTAPLLRMSEGQESLGVTVTQSEL